MCVPKRLYSIRMEQNVVLPGYRRKLLDRMKRTYLVVYHHDADEYRFIRDSLFEIFGIEPPLIVYRQIRHLYAFFFEIIESVKHRVMLLYRCDYVVAFFYILIGHSLENPIVRLRPATCENNLGRIGTYQSCNLVLSNVKTRGVLGEIQLAAILEEILPHEQYEENVNTTGEAGNVVEFAVKLPGAGEEPVWLPIDAKFPGDTYQKLLDAYETGDAKIVDAAKKELVSIIKKEAKDINRKYISPPKTTNFGIMFLPFEGLYSEVIRLGMVELLQREYRVNIAGPTTIAAMLNSLQMGFRTLAIQKRSDEVWKVLGAVRREFEKFEAELLKAKKNISQANKNLDTLIGTRSNKVLSSLKKVEKLPDSESPEPESVIPNRGSVTSEFECRSLAEKDDISDAGLEIQGSESEMME